jgi:2,5-dihydroxypyridine 5,6-dioxygenase
MLRKLKTVDLIVQTCAQVKAGQQILVLADDHGSAVKCGQQIAESCTAAGAEVVVMIMAPRQYNGHEPPRCVAEALLACDMVFIVFAGGPPIVHTNAAMNARAKGIRNVLVSLLRNEDRIDQDMSLVDLNLIKTRTERIAEMLSQADTAHVTSAGGTDLKLNLKGRPGLGLHPMSSAAILSVPDSGEAAIAPLEGLTEGVLVSDGGILDWPVPPREPVTLTAKAGRVTDVSGPDDYVARMKKLLATDGNASNFAAELGIGTSHLSPRLSRGGLGTCHLAVGRNSDIAGNVHSQVHNDLIVLQPTLWIGKECLIKEGKLQIE